MKQKEQNHDLEYPSAQMSIDLIAMRHNLMQCRNYLQPSTKIMLILKAHAYGTRVKETTRWVEQTGQVDYFAVAFIDEGVEMRQVGVTLPIMVMNVDASAFELCQRYHLEPVIYSLSLMNKLVQWVEDSREMTNETTSFSFPNIHIKLNTGMNRLGLDLSDLSTLIILLSKSPAHIHVKSIYSHLAASDDPKEDTFTAEQAHLLKTGAEYLEEHLHYSVMKHLCNTFGIVRHRKFHFDMVRLGAGIFGGGCFPPSFNFQPAISLTTVISQIRYVKDGETMGYNRRGLAKRDTRIGILRIGYADGLRRQMGHGQAFVWLRHCRVPIIKGSVCMDMTSIDLTDVPVEDDSELENEHVEIFGKHIDIQEVAQWCGTIAYELITSINQRVKRVYIED